MTIGGAVNTNSPVLSGIYTVWLNNGRYVSALWVDIAETKKNCQQSQILGVPMIKFAHSVGNLRQN